MRNRKKLSKSLALNVKIARHIKKIIFLLLAVAVFCLMFFGVKVEKIICENQYQNCSKSISDMLVFDEKKGFISTVKKMNKVLAHNNLVEKYYLKYVPLRTIKVNVVERTAKYSVKKDSEADIYLIDKNGYVIDTKKETSLPLIMIDESDIYLGQKVDKNTYFCLELLSDIIKYTDIESTRIGSDSFTVEVDGGTRLLFPLEGNSKLLSAKTFYVLSKKTVILDNGKRSGFDKIDEVDFRFKNPVIRYI